MRNPNYRLVEGALERLNRSISRAEEQVSFIRTRRANLLTAPYIEQMAITFVNHALARAEQELAELREAAEDLRAEMLGEAAA